MTEVVLHDRLSLLTRFKDDLEIFHRLGSAATSVLSALLDKKIVDSVKSRVKEFDSFYSKANRTLKKGDEIVLKYEDPFAQIVDIVGIRVVVIARHQIDEVCAAVRSAFDVVEEENKAEKLLRNKELGYESFHLICKIGNQRASLAEYSGLGDRCFEIQVRSVLQHAWAENEHRLQYKGSSNDPEIHKRFLRLAGLMSLADEEFDVIYRKNSEVVKAVSEGLESDVAIQLVESSEVQPAGPPSTKQQTSYTAELSSIVHRYGVRPAELVEAGRTSEALDVYNSLIQFQPTQAGHYIGRARLFLQMGEFKRAAEDVVKAFHLSPNMPGINTLMNQLGEFIY